MPVQFSEGSEPLPGYRLKRYLGRGGFGEVWEAAAPGDIPIAIKFVRLEDSLSENEERELEIVRTVRHAHLLDVHFVRETDGYLVMGMPLCDQDLHGRLKECQNERLPGIPVEELLELMEEAAKAIDYLHQHDVVHRDIKPHNIMLVGNTAKVGDFGLAKVVERSFGFQSGDRFTPAYVAPEMIQGKACRASDQYSLAVSYCELRVGKLPFETHHMMELVHAHLERSPILSAYGPREADVLRRALSKQPDDRWHNCRAFIQALREAYRSTSAETLHPVTTQLTNERTDESEKTSPDKQVDVAETEEWNDNCLKMPFVWCRPGRFLMGSQVDEEGRYVDEAQVEVRLTDGFWLGKYTVTQAEWRQLMGSEPWSGEHYVRENSVCPATYVSWDDAMAFCKKLNEREQQSRDVSPGWEYTLPTEAMWEYACRAGTTSRYSFSDRAEELRLYAWFDDDSDNHADASPHPVGQKGPNPWGLHDMHGNIWEWCRDWYHSSLTGGTDPEAKRSSSGRVIRGGCFRDASHVCRSAYRGNTESRPLNDVGLRVARILRMS